MTVDSTGVHAGAGMTGTPIAYGNFASDGSTNVASSNISCSWNAAGLRYECAVTNQSMYWYNYVYVVTAGDTGAPLIATVNSVNPKVIVAFYNLSGSKVQAASGFSFAIFKP